MKKGEIMSNKKIDKKLLQEYNEDMKQIGKNIRKWRNDKRISQQELAKKVGLERNSISVIENGSSASNM